MPADGVQKSRKGKWPQLKTVEYRNGTTAYMVDTRINGQGERLFFKTKSEAEGKQLELRTKRENDGKVGVQIPEKLRVAALECEDLLKPLGATIRQATDFYLQHHKATTGTVTCTEAAKKLTDAKRAAGKRESYLKALGWSFGVFNRTFGEEKTSEITRNDVEEWLDEQTFKLATRRAYIRDLGILFGYSVKQGFSAINPVVGIEKPVLEDEEPEIFKVEEAAALLNAASKDPESKLVPFLAIGLFAGLRTSELKTLDWAEVELEEKVIEVTGKKAKTRQRRLVKISDNLGAWLSPYAEKSGPIVSGRFRERLSAVLTAARAELTQHGHKGGLVQKWPKNGMRHSFASYHLALHHDAALTALELGHADTTMLFAHYRNLVKPKDAERFWKILPPKKKKTKTKEPTSPSPKSPQPESKAPNSSGDIQS